MYAVEFQSSVGEDGAIIVPKEYKDKIGKNVKVILLSSDTGVENNDLTDFSSVRVKTKGFKFDREYANER